MTRITDASPRCAQTATVAVTAAVTTTRVQPGRLPLRLAGMLALSLSLAACANSAKLTYLPSGNTGFAINCSGSDASAGWGDCYKQASEACGAYGYDVVNKDDEKGTTGGSLIGVFGANIKSRSMVIQCHK